MIDQLKGCAALFMSFFVAVCVLMLVALVASNVWMMIFN